jgi:hypothetical protein
MFSYDDYIGAEHFIANYINDKSNSIQSFFPNKKQIMQYCRKEQAKQFAAIIG